MLLGGAEVGLGLVGGLAGLCLVAGVLAAVSGTGGGSLFIPVFSLAFPEDVHRAVPLSKIAVFGVALGACLINFIGGGGQNTSSYINYSIATLIQPATLLGCLFGVFLNLLLPSVVITALLVCILSFVAYKTIQTGLKQRAETKAAPVIRVFASLDTPTTLASPEPSPIVHVISTPSLGSLEDGIVPSEAATPLLVSKKIPPQEFGGSTKEGRFKEIALLSTSWAVNALCLTMAGGPAALACGPWKMRLWTYGLIVFQVMFITCMGYRLLRRKQTTSTPELWFWVEPLRMIYYCALSCLAGLCAGLLGIGGGLIKGPLLISIGLIPVNAVATSNYMVLFTSSTNVLAFLLAGRLDLFHSSLFGLVTMTGGIIGVVTLRQQLSQSRRQYILTLILGSSIILGGVAMSVVNIRSQLSLKSDTELRFSEACSLLTKFQ